MLVKILLVICIINNVSLFIDARRNLEVTTSVGTVKGQLKTSTNGNDFIAFEGIPYAKPPIGDLRFKPPQMPDPWDDQPLIANQLYECLQTSIIPEEKHIKGDEDCLYINVYKPSKESTEPLDVMEYSNTLPKINWKTAARKIRNYYLKGRAISADNLNDFVQIFTDRLFVHDAERAARMQAKSQKSPVYYMHFNYNHGNLLTGVPHTSDAEFFYGFDHTNSSEVASNEDMNEICMEILKSFAKTGYPDIKDVDWEPTKSDKLSYLNLTNPDNIRMQTAFELAPHQFWRDLGITEYENYIQTFKKYMDIMF